MADRENNTINLKVAESRQRDAGKGIVRIGRSDINELPNKVNPGYITGLRITGEVKR